MKPEERARQQIDEQLQATGWTVQSRQAANLGAARGVAVGEFPLTTGFADYMLFVDRRPIGVIEAKAVGTPLSGVEAQTARYSAGLPPLLQANAWHTPLPLLCQSTGVETFFIDVRDPEPRSRRVFTFHRPETLAEWAGQPQTLRAHLCALPPLIPTGLWPAQIEAVQNLERSLAADRPRALIQMATGSGKTYAAVTFVYRLIKHARARRPGGVSGVTHSCGGDKTSFSAPENRSGPGKTLATRCILLERVKNLVQAFRCQALLTNRPEISANHLEDDLQAKVVM